MTRQFVGELAPGIVVPATGCVMGADDAEVGAGFTGPNGIETLTGRKVPIHNHHRSIGTASLGEITDTLKADIAAGAIPMLSINGAGWPSGGYPVVLAGYYEAWLRQLGGALGALGTGVLFRFLMEMNGQHNPYYGATPGSPTPAPASYVAFWTRALDLIEPLAPNVVSIWCPQEYGDDTASLAAQYLPVNRLPKIIGVDHYRSTLEAALPFFDLARNHGRLTMICEAGYQHGQTVTDSRGLTFDKDASVTGNSLILRVANQLQHWPNVWAYVLWPCLGNVVINGQRADNRIQTTPASLAQHKMFMNRAYYGGTP